MAIVTAFIRVSTTKKKEANVRFILRDGRASVIIFKRTESKTGTLESEERGDFDYFLSIRKLSDVRTRNFRVLYRALQRFEYYRRLNVYKKYTLKYDSVTVRVPLNSIVKEIPAKYKHLPFDELLPMISQQKYNVAIKKMFLEAVPLLVIAKSMSR